MSIRYLTTYVTAGYTLSHSFGGLYIEPTGGVGGTGVLATFNADIWNRGVISAANGKNGISLTAGGYVENFAGGSISSKFGQLTSSAVDISGGAGFVHNLGYISGYDGVILDAGGSVTNGTPARQNATIYADGLAVGADTVANYGTLVTAFGTALVAQGANARIVNGSPIDTHALILGPASAVIVDTSANISNLGTIESSGGSAIRSFGGEIDNGTANNQVGLIAGIGGISAFGSLTIHNFGSIDGEASDGIELSDGGGVYNGSRATPGGFISGQIGVYATSGKIGNYGTIDGAGLEGVRLAGAAVLVNGTGPNRTALIEGGTGINSLGGGLITNYGTVRGTDPVGFGLKLFDSAFINGANHDTTALIEGYEGVKLLGPGPAGATSTNYGAIMSLGAYDGIAAYLGDGAFLTNGSSTDAAATISGPIAVFISGATLDNFGVISGPLDLDGPNSTLIVEAGSTFDGKIAGYGTLELGSGVGTITAATLAAITISGSMATTVFPGFQTLQIGPAASFSLPADVAIGAGQELSDQGALNVAGAISSAGSVFVTGTLAGSGSLNLTGGVAAFNPGCSVSIAEISESGPATSLIALAPNLTLSGAFIQNSGTFANLSGGVTSFTGVGDAFSGTLTGGGTFVFAGGTDAIDVGASITAGAWSISGGVASIDTSLNFGGIFTDSVTVSVGSGDTLALSGASTFVGLALVNGAGAVSLKNATIGDLSVGGVITLNDTGTVVQAGAMILGDSSTQAATLSIAAGATWNITGDVGIGRGHSGASAIKVAGALIKSAGTGTTTIKPKISDGGLIEVAAGTLDLAGALAGKGGMRIDFQSTLEVDANAAASLTFTFDGRVATLALAKPSTFAATIAGYAPSDTIDLLDIAATGASINGSDQLVIVNGSGTVATLKLTGTYSNATFTVTSDGRGGTDVTLLTTSRSPQAFAAMMAALAGGDGGLPALSASPPIGPHATLLSSPVAR